MVEADTSNNAKTPPETAKTPVVATTPPLTRTPSSPSKKTPPSEKTSKDLDGEVMSGFDSDEWEFSEPAYNPELINLKTKPNKITVFRASRTIQRTERPKISTTASDAELTAKSISNESTQSSNLAMQTNSLTNESNVSQKNSSKEATANMVAKDVNPELSSSPLSSFKNSGRIPTSTMSAEKGAALDKAELIGRLVADLIRTFMKDRREEDVEIKLRLFNEKEF